MINSALLNEIADQIESEPKSFNMASWVQSNRDCGTQFCVAGWAIIKSTTNKPVFDSFEENLTQWLYKMVPEDKSIREYASELLGITEETADYLFFAWEDEYSVSFPTLLRELAKGKSIDDFYIDEEGPED